MRSLQINVISGQDEQEIDNLASINLNQEVALLMLSKWFPKRFEVGEDAID